MNNYVIGDIQGCFTALEQLLTQINFHEHTDRLWFVGDLVNRGPESLAVLRFIKQLPLAPRITLGNHDLHLLRTLFCKNIEQHHGDTLNDVLTAPDAAELGHWLRKQKILYHDHELNIVTCHAGINPMWDLSLAKSCAYELEQELSGDNYQDYLTHMYGDKPEHWDPELKGYERLRIICNSFTRMRFCNQQGDLSLTYKGSLPKAPEDLYPWYAVPNRKHIAPDIIFGHWSALKGQCSHPKIHAIDTGFLWGGELTALRIEDKQRFTISAINGDKPC